MDFEISPYIVYVQINDSGYITAINSSAFLTETTGWAKIAEGYGDKYHHAQGNYFELPIVTENGAYRYKFANNAVIESTAAEIEAQEAANKAQRMPTHDERIEALEAAVTMLCLPDIDEV